jgi:hypothetical protein
MELSHFNRDETAAKVGHPALVLASNFLARPVLSVLFCSVL